MITQANSSAVRAAYPSNTNDAKMTKSGANTSSSEVVTSKIEQLKESIDSGEYKVNIEALSQKIADSLL